MFPFHMHTKENLILLYLVLVHGVRQVEAGHDGEVSWTAVLFRQAIAEGELANLFDTWSISDVAIQSGTLCSLDS